MFEETKPIFTASNAPVAADSPATAVDGASASALVSASGEHGELRQLEWSELTARLSAARDLRRVLHREARRKFASQSGGFADAAARFFRAKHNNEQGINLVALEQSKGSSCIPMDNTSGYAAEAMREKKND